MNDKEIIREKLIYILKNKYEVNIDKKDDICDLNLLGRSIKMGPSDLMCFLLDIEKQFNIIASEEDILRGRFKTVNTITELIYEKTA